VSTEIMVEPELP